MGDRVTACGGQMDQVGHEIKKLREERGWSQAKLAVEAGMSVSGVSMIENGKRNLSTATLEKLASALEVEVRDLFPPLGQAPLFTGRPEENREERRREIMANSFAQLIDLWEREVEKRESPTLSRSIATNCHLAIEAITKNANLGGKWGSGQLTEEEFLRIEDEYKADRAPWWALQDRLYAIARQGIEHYEASEEAKAAEVQTLREHQEEIREEIRRRTRELSA
jgi:transcriptional regulator with XRE-family HTH domain